LEGAAAFWRCEDRYVARFYRLVRLVLDVLVLHGGRDRSKDLEIRAARPLRVLRGTPPGLDGTGEISLRELVKFLLANLTLRIAALRFLRYRSGMLVAAWL
jgi:hypothetical protein